MMASLTIIEILPNVDGGSHLFQNLQHKAKENGRGVEFGWIKARLGEFQKNVRLFHSNCHGGSLTGEEGGIGRSWIWMMSNELSIPNKYIFELYKLIVPLSNSHKETKQAPWQGDTKFQNQGNPSIRAA